MTLASDREQEQVLIASTRSQDTGVLVILAEAASYLRLTPGRQLSGTRLKVSSRLTSVGQHNIMSYGSVSSRTSYVGKGKGKALSAPHISPRRKSDRSLHSTFETGTTSPPTERDRLLTHSSSSMSTTHHNDRSSEVTAIDMSTPSSSTDQAGVGKPSDPKGDVVQNEQMKRRGDREDGKHILQQEEAMDQLPYTWTPKKKWTILSVIFVVQCSMNCEYLFIAGVVK